MNDRANFPLNLATNHELMAFIAEHVQVMEFGKQTSQCETPSAYIQKSGDDFEAFYAPTGQRHHRSLGIFDLKDALEEIARVWK